MTTLKTCVPSELTPPLNYVLISDAAGLVKVQDFFKRVSAFVIDVETNIDDNFVTHHIRTIQVGDRNEQYIIDLLPFAKAAGLTIPESQGHYKPNSCYQPIVDALRPVLESKSHLKIGHNLQFDYEKLKWNLGLRMWNLYDTLLAEKVIYAGKVNFNVSGFWALDDCVARYAGLLISKAEQKSFNFTDDLTESQIIYCALDCRVPFAVKAGQYDKLVKGNLLRALQIENDAIPAFGDMFLNGMKLDTEKWMKLVNGIKQQHERHVAKLDEFFIPIVGHKSIPEYDLVELEQIWKDTKDKEERAEARKKFMACRKAMKDAKENFEWYEGNAAINYGSNPQLLAALRKMGFDAKGMPDTNDRTLKNKAEHPKWDLKKVLKEDPELTKVGVIDTLRLYRETKKILTTYGENFLTKYINPHTGRIHSRILQLGAETGRTSSREPNLQNIPRGSEWRACFVCDDGYKVATLDYNGCELRILAEYSREPVFLNAFLNNWDVHSVGAEIVFGDEWKNAAEEGCEYYINKQKCSCKRHKELRDIAKTINFGIAYGMEAQKLADSIGMTSAQAKEYLERGDVDLRKLDKKFTFEYHAAAHILKRYRDSFPVLINYLKDSGKSATERFEARTLAQRRRFFHKPTWEEAKQKAKAMLYERRCKKEGKSVFAAYKNKDEAIAAISASTRDISSAYKAMYSAIEREGKNTPIQGSNADLAKIAMGCGYGSDGQGFMWHELEPKYGARLVNFVHDEFVIWIPDGSQQEECFNYAGGTMQRAGVELVKLIPMTWEGHLKNEWSK
jgi:DNA polymerase I-like protein with 3'-5' exonuclease and polymerase domains